MKLIGILSIGLLLVAVSAWVLADELAELFE